MAEEVEVKDTELKVIHRGFEIKNLKPDGSFSGYGSTFGNVDEGNDICDEKCFDRTLAEMKKSDGMPGMFFSHDIREPVGEWDVVEKDKKGLYAEGRIAINQGIPKAQQAYLMLKSKGPKGLSIGYSTKKYSYDEKKGVRTLLDVDLLEISPTPFPMNRKAKITGVKSLLVGKTNITVREAEDILRDAGFTSGDAKHFLSCLKSGYFAEREALQELDEAIKSTIQILRG